ncbi:MAG TPA: IPT/TIG domain-containing protein, partial [Aliidongia sp.]|nr:IPT/TIG domain-containing protein [Aliidongia sp.]
CAFCGGANAPLVAGNGDTFVDTNNTYANNVTYGGLGVQLFDNDTKYFSCASNKCDTNPMLVNPAASNFAVQANSPTIGYGQVVSLLQASPVFAGACSSLFTTCPGNTGPTVTSLTPTSGPAAGGTSVTIAGSGFTGASSVKFGGVSGTGISVVNDDQITVTAPAGSAGLVDITVTTPNGTSPTSASDEFTYAALTAPPVTGPVTATVGYGSVSNAIALNLSGGPATSVSIASAPAHGAATASGTSIRYTPAAGFFGGDSFTYKAANTAGTSTAATISINVPAPTVSVAPTTLAGGTVGTAYSQSLAASGGQGPYTFSTTLASGTLPGGLALSSNGTISGTPTTVGTFSFTVKGTDSSAPTHASFTSGTISLIIAAPGTPIVATISPASGPTFGGNAVTITGANLNGATGVKFGTVAATGVTVVSAGKIVATVPGGAVGTVDVRVTTALGTSPASALDHYTYVVPDTIAGHAYIYQSTLGTAGTAGTDNSHLSHPGAGAVDVANGHLLVADTGNHRIQIIDTDALTVVGTIGVPGVSGSDNAHLNQPGGVECDNAGHILVADTGNHRIQIFDAKSLTYAGTLGVSGVAGTGNDHFNLPASIHMNAAAHQLYVADSGNHRIQIFNAQAGTYIGTIGSAGVSGSDNAHFNQPRDAEINQSTNQIMVADSGNGRVQLFEADSFTYDSTIGGPTVSPADNLYFSTPVTAAFDPTTNLVLVTDAGLDDRVEVLDALSYNYVLTLGTTASSGTANTQFAGPVGATIDPIHARLFLSDRQNNRVQVFSIEAPFEFAAVLPGSRSVQLDNTATIFASMINSGSNALDGCRISLPANAPAGLTMDYQTTDPATNIPVGAINMPATIPGNNGVQTFLLSFRGTTAFNASNMTLDYGCSGVAPAPVTVGVDTIDLAMSEAAVPDIIALAATATDNGIVVVPTGGRGAFALASANVGVAASLTVSVDTGTATLPVTATLCQTNPATSQCLTTPAGSVAVNIAADATPTFSIFLQSTGPIPLSPGASRIFVRFMDASGAPHGSSSVAIETQ